MHTLPINHRPWTEHANTMMRSVEEFLTVAARQHSEEFGDIRRWVDDLVDAAHGVNSHLLAAEPFAPFDVAQANNVLSSVEGCLDTAADAIETGVQPKIAGDALRGAAGRWIQLASRCDSATPVQTAFRMSRSPIDSTGEFRAEWVLQEYAYNSGQLLSRVVPHLESLGVAHVDDVLACISIVGWLLNCDDPMSAYVAMDMFLRMYAVADPSTATLVLEHLDGTEPAMRRSTRAARRSHSLAVENGTNREAQALALVDFYKRMVEGPFRQLSWACYCLKSGRWESPVMLGPLRDRLVAGGGDLATFVRQVVLPEIRNSETHETLAWDGFAEVFVTDVGRIAPLQVAAAASLAESFIHGCEAAIASVRTLRSEPDRIPLPAGDEPGRLASWRRVHAFFGTNRLRLVEAQLNTRHARIEVENLGFRDINPCFQALLLAHRLLGRIEVFSVGTAVLSPIIEVSAEALDATTAAWEFAIANVDQMPLATFLPANFDARRRTEPADVAIRSACWIAIDDALDAIDGSPEEWTNDTRSLLATRLRIVELALTGAARLFGEPNVRVNSVLRSIEEIRRWIAEESPVRFTAADSLTVVAQLRIQWARWGPVPRHPLVADERPSGLVETRSHECRPALRQPPSSYRYRTL